MSPRAVPCLPPRCQPPPAHLPVASARCLPAAQVQESRPRAVPRLLSQCRLSAGPRVERGSWARERSPACHLVSSPLACSPSTAAPPPWPAVSRGEGSASASDPAPPNAAQAPQPDVVSSPGSESANGPLHSPLPSRCRPALPQPGSRASPRPK